MRPRCGRRVPASRGSNADSTHRAPAERREAERLLVRSIEEILDAAEQLEAPLEGPAPAQVPHGEAGRVEEAAKRSEGRLDGEDVPAATAAHPGRERSTDGHHVDRPLVTR